MWFELYAKCTQTKNKHLIRKYVPGFILTSFKIFSHLSGSHLYFSTCASNIKKSAMRWDFWCPQNLRLFSPHLFFMSICIVFSASYIHATSQFCHNDFPAVYKPQVVSVSSHVLVPISAILILAADCMLLPHQLVIGPVTNI